MVETKDTKVEKEVKQVKKLDDVKDTPENKAAIAEAEGKISEEDMKKGLKVTADGAIKGMEKPQELADNITKELNKDAGNKKESKPAVEKKTKKEKKGEVKIELEREYVVPLKRGVLNVPHYRRAKKAVRVLKEFMVRHMKVRDRDLRKVKVDINLNNEIWFRGIKKPMNKIKVKAKKIDGIVYVELAEIPAVVGYKIAREERRAAAVKDVKKPKAAEKEEKSEEEKTEEKEDAKAGAEKGAKDSKIKAKAVQHTAKGSHAQKTMPVRKSLKK